MSDHCARSLCLVLACAAALAALGAAPALGGGPRGQGWLGVSLVDASAWWEGVDAEALAEDAPREGAVVAGVVVDSPADDAGLRASDVVLAVDGEAVVDASDLVRIVQSKEPDHWIDLTISRHGEERRVQARLVVKPERSRRRDMRQGWIGVAPVQIPEALREYWGGNAERGVLVGAVDEAGPADIAGIRPGDMILSIDGRPIGDARALVLAVRRGGVGNALEVAVSRQGALFEVDVEVEERPDPEPGRASRDGRRDAPRRGGRGRGR